MAQKSTHLNQISHLGANFFFFFLKHNTRTKRDLNGCGTLHILEALVVMSFLTEQSTDFLSLVGFFLNVAFFPW